jgi:hypothetical protein
MIRGISVEKRVTWREQPEDFANVYHYDSDATVSSEELLDAIVAAERPMFVNAVSYIRGQVWGPTDGTKEQSQMLFQKNLSGLGTSSVGSLTPSENTAVLSWDTGRVNTRGGRVYLRKYLHVCGISATSQTAAAMGNNALPASEILKYKNFGNSIKTIIGASGAHLCDKKGRRLPLGTDCKVLPHLRIRQFRR